ncbi:hypothetical protein DQ353_06805 [Arthrobacter sp. AQ5-05]|uniref:hypothetical protein n=1 Tax=Arthrobacter sp. AQ5-05 TaxID=2184581 RepID=UPI000DCF5F6C|nr:hypothetical protein [Arthrobacter sp. AQ5-05]RAX49870.1 hypothetical protein DQ353_06805 [Arthrobacter sp. AQ5-05]
MIPFPLLANPQEPGPGNAAIPAITLAVATTGDIAPAIVCQTCHSGEYLVYEQVTPVRAKGSAPAAWDVECWCGRCEEFHGVRTTRAPSIPYSMLQHGFSD